MTCIAQALYKYERELQAFLLKRVGEPALAEDLLQEVKLKALQQGKQFCSVLLPRAWLYRVTRNVLIDYLRSNHPNKALPIELNTSHLSAHQEEPETIEQLSECLTRNLERLTSADKDIVEHCDLRNETLKAYSQQQGMSLSAAKARLLRARKKLRSNIEQHCSVSFNNSGKVSDYIKPK